MQLTSLNTEELIDATLSLETLTNLEEALLQKLIEEERKHNNKVEVLKSIHETISKELGL